MAGIPVPIASLGTAFVTGAIATLMVISISRRRRVEGDRAVIDPQLARYPCAIFASHWVNAGRSPGGLLRILRLEGEPELATVLITPLRSCDTLLDHARYLPRVKT